MSDPRYNYTPRNPIIEVHSGDFLSGLSPEQLQAICILMGRLNTRIGAGRRFGANHNYSARATVELSLSWHVLAWRRGQWISLTNDKTARSRHAPANRSHLSRCLVFRGDVLVRIRRGESDVDTSTPGFLVVNKRQRHDIKLPIVSASNGRLVLKLPGGHLSLPHPYPHGLCHALPGEYLYPVLPGEYILH